MFSLSEQLYQNSTHFLLELLQNADDNTYHACEPRLHITYANHQLRIDCNEVGFGKKNVEAICKIGRSTKIGLDSSTRYIGEKGIGFKSVFKVADVVWIASGFYSFKFDKKEKLGMIAPIWERFPRPRLPGYTSILLQLSRTYDPNELVDEIKALDPRFLIFLRQLKHVKITCHNKNGKVWESTLGRSDVPRGPSLQNVIDLQFNSASSSYQITKYNVDSLPSEPKRLGCALTEILLAFPIKSPGEPWIESQKVYAFLPIRDYGFKVGSSVAYLISLLNFCTCSFCFKLISY
jgi:hypothetical protein